MSFVDQLGVALGLATLAGVNLYLTVLVAGLAVRYHWIDLTGSYEPLAVLGNPWVIGVAGVFFTIEFFADKTPWLDSLWDSVHTLIRPVGGAALALTALGELDPLFTTLAALLAGGAALSTHSTKAAVRGVVNLSPEPLSNSVASVTEDGMVLGGLALIGLFPTIALFVFIGVVILCTVCAIYLWKRILRFRRSRHQDPHTA